ncbi:MAG: glycerophosphodiester phosphodiesterase family protein [Blastomonas sp.]
MLRSRWMRLLLSGLLDNWLAPPPDPSRTAWLGEWRYAHRGLHDGLWQGPVLENSGPSFDAAIAQGLGIECDVQVSSDHRAMVFHDYILERLTGEKGAVAARNSAELQQITLRGDNGCILPLSAMLDKIGGKVPVLIEIKSEDRRHAPLCLAVRRALEGYGGKAAVMSFNPLVANWFRRHAPHVLRGLVVTEENAKGMLDRLGRHAALWSAKPDFLAYDIRDLPSRFAAAQRMRGLPVLSWTVRDDAQMATASAHADAPIFERAASR